MLTNSHYFFRIFLFILFLTNFHTNQVEADWYETAYLKAANIEEGDKFGSAVSISADVAVVGAYTEDSNQTTITNGPTASADNSFLGSGAVYVFRTIGGDWVEEAYLKAANANTFDLFGCSVAISGDVIVVGAIGESSNQTTVTNGPTASSDNSLTYAGAAYVYRRVAGNWVEEAYLKAPNPDSLDTFGSSVAIAGNVIVVGAPEESSNQTTVTNGDTASADNSFPSSGAAYVFRRVKTPTLPLWKEEAYLKAPNANEFDHFGYAVGTSEDTIAVAAYGEDSNQTTVTNGDTASADNSASYAGAAYVFRYVGGLWGQEAYLKPSNSEIYDYFASSIAISGNRIIVGAPGEDSNQTTVTNGDTASADNTASSAGAAYIFRRIGTNWQQEAYLKAANAQSYDYFGDSVGISEDVAVVGASGEDSNQTTVTNGPTASSDNSLTYAGAAYVYRRVAGNWVEEAYLKAANADTSDQFGEFIATSKGHIIVSTKFEDSNQTTITNGPTASPDNSALNAGAAYVYKNL